MIRGIFLISVGIITVFLTGCSCKPKVKYVYVKQKCPTLQTLKLNELNLTKTKPLELHIKVKENNE